jgi:hypothetical protein
VASGTPLTPESTDGQSAGPEGSGPVGNGPAACGGGGTTTGGGGGASWSHSLGTYPSGMGPGGRAGEPGGPGAAPPGSESVTDRRYRRPKGPHLQGDPPGPK